MKTLDTFAALAPGADLWIVTDLSSSKWTRKIDWYLNYQIQRAGARVPEQVSSRLKEVAESVEYEIQDTPRLPTDAPLLISSRGLLPNQKTLLIPTAGTFADWVVSCHATWSGLQKPSVRVFLPASVGVEDFRRAWPKADAEASVEVVPESEMISH